jgi:hypothetical protein
LIIDKYTRREDSKYEENKIKRPMSSYSNRHRNILNESDDDVIKNINLKRPSSAMSKSRFKNFEKKKVPLLDVEKLKKNFENKNKDFYKNCNNDLNYSVKKNNEIINKSGNVNFGSDTLIVENNNVKESFGFGRTEKLNINIPSVSKDKELNSQDSKKILKNFVIKKFNLVKKNKK